MDARRLEQVVANLVDNAVKCSPRGGRVQITLHGDEREHRLAASDEDLQARATENKADDLLRKPFAVTSREEQIERILVKGGGGGPPRGHGELLDGPDPGGEGGGTSCLAYAPSFAYAFA